MSANMTKIISKYGSYLEFQTPSASLQNSEHTLIKYRSAVLFLFLESCLQKPHPEFSETNVVVYFSVNFYTLPLVCVYDA